jgi:hypothetical protein
MIDPAHLDELCTELRVFLDAELAAGNRIIETSKGWPLPSSILVLLHSAFHNSPAQLPPNVRLVEVNDPHWWKQEYIHITSGHRLACRF